MCVCVFFVLWHQQVPESFDIVHKINVLLLVHGPFHDSTSWLNNTFFGSLSPRAQLVERGQDALHAYDEATDQGMYTVS